ncbi:MAG: hypothetical protein WC679_00130 [Bacteroidales bacterium]|jgi:hypothetical protein
MQIDVRRVAIASSEVVGVDIIPGSLAWITIDDGSQINLPWNVVLELVRKVNIELKIKEG